MLFTLKQRTATKGSHAIDTLLSQNLQNSLRVVHLSTKDEFAYEAFKTRAIQRNDDDDDDDDDDFQHY